MKTADQLFQQMTDLGVELRLEGEQIRINAPKGSLTPELRAELAGHKEELRAVLLDRERLDRKLDGPTRVFPRPEKAPASFAQQRIWFLSRLDDKNAVYNMAVIKHLRGEISIPILEKSLQAIISRHETLRTIYLMEDGLLRQRIMPVSEFRISLLDLSDHNADEREQCALKQAEEETQVPFDLANDLMLRVKVIILTAAEHIMVVTMHHIASDGWSFDIFWRELGALYHSFHESQPSPLPELSVQYADYAIWQQQWLQGERLERQADYWRQKLSGLKPLNIPTDCLRPAVQSYRGDEVRFKLEGLAYSRLQAFAQQEGITLFMTLLAGFSILLQRYSGQDDIAAGTLIANRQRPEIEKLIGLFINTLVLRNDLSADPTVRQFLRQVRENTLDAYDHQDIPFEKLLELLQPERDLGQNPLFQVLFLFRKAGDDKLILPGVVIEDIYQPRLTSPLDLTLDIKEAPEGLEGIIEYNTDIFDSGTIERLAENYPTLLRGLAENPERKISQLPLLTPKEEAELRSWNRTDRDFGEIPALVEQFYSQVRLHSDEPAFLVGDQIITFGELNRRSNKLANYLLSRGQKAGGKIGLSIERSLDVPVGLLAIFKIGSVYVPLDPGYPQQRLRYVVQDAGVKTILTTTEFAGIFGGFNEGDQIIPELICLDELTTELENQPDSDPEPQTGPDALAYVIYTSGSTGRPKGVEVAHRQILNRLAWMWAEYPLQDEDVGCQKTALNFVDSLWELFGYLLQGKPTVIIAGEDTRDPRRLVEVLSQKNVTQLWLVPSLLRAILQVYPDLQARLPKLRFWVSSGEPLPNDLLRQFQEAMPQAVLYNLYGTSEVWDVTWFDPEREEVTAQGANVSIGRPISNMRTYILDKHLNQVPVGVPGELCVSGVGLGEGYINLPEATAERFVTNFHTGAGGDGQETAESRLYRSGDLVRWLPDGQIEFLGRIDQQLKIRGHRVEPGEIESLLRQREEIKDSAVIKKGEGDAARLIAFVAAADGQNPQPDLLKSYLASWLPEVMLPWQIIPLDNFPLTPSGKVDRQALGGMQIEVDFENEYVEPRSLLEGTLVEIWREVLNVPQIGVHDNFFELGGHSLLGVSLFSRIEEAYGIRLPLSLLFQTPTVAKLAQHMEQTEDIRDTGALVAIQPRGTRPPFFFVHGLWGIVMDYMELARNLGPDQPFYGLSASEYSIEAYPDDTIEAMAARYITEIQRVQQEGPYRIGGFSYGGLIAYEVARQLELRGQGVALLAIVEGIASEYAVYPIYHPQRIRNILANVPNWPAEYRNLGKDELKRWSINKSQRFWARVQKSLGKDVDLRQYKLTHPDAPGVPDRFQELSEHHMRMLNGFKLQPYGGKVTLLRSSWHTVGRAFLGTLDPQLGWGSLAGQGVEILEISGNHHTLLHKPHVTVLARQINKALESVLSEGPS